MASGAASTSPRRKYVANRRITSPGEPSPPRARAARSRLRYVPGCSAATVLDGYRGDDAGSGVWSGVYAQRAIHQRHPLADRGQAHPRAPRLRFGDVESDAVVDDLESDRLRVSRQADRDALGSRMTLDVPQRL